MRRWSLPAMVFSLVPTAFEAGEDGVVDEHERDTERSAWPAASPAGCSVRVGGDPREQVAEQPWLGAAL